MNSYYYEPKRRDKDVMFYSEVVRPFVETFQGFSDYIVTKLILIGGYVATASVYDLFTNPTDYWQYLALLVILDLVSGVWYSLHTKGVRFRFRLMIRKSLFKSTSYIIVCYAFWIMGEGFPVAFNYVEYTGYFALFALEFTSILRNLKFTFLFRAFGRVLRQKVFVAKKIGSLTFREFLEEVEEEERNAERTENETGSYYAGQMRYREGDASSGEGPDPDPDPKPGDKIAK